MNRVFAKRFCLLFDTVKNNMNKQTLSEMKILMENIVTHLIAAKWVDTKLITMNRVIWILNKWMEKMDLGFYTFN